jgi:hypothetical protein
MTIKPLIRCPRFWSMNHWAQIVVYSNSLPQMHRKLLYQYIPTTITSPNRWKQNFLNKGISECLFYGWFHLELTLVLCLWEGKKYYPSIDYILYWSPIFWRPCIFPLNSGNMASETSFTRSEITLKSSIFRLSFDSWTGQSQSKICGPHFTRHC